MLTCALANHIWTDPLFGGQINVPSLIAFQQTPLQTFWPWLLASLLLVEVGSILQFDSPLRLTGAWSLISNEGSPMQMDLALFSMKGDREPGNLGFDPLRLRPSSRASQRDMASRELNHGRLAMIGTSGMVAQELVTGTTLFA